MRTPDLFSNAETSGSDEANDGQRPPSNRGLELDDFNFPALSPLDEHFFNKDTEYVKGPRPPPFPDWMEDNPFGEGCSNTAPPQLPSENHEQRGAEQAKQKIDEQAGIPHEQRSGEPPINHQEQRHGEQTRSHHEQQFGELARSHHEQQLGAQSGSYHEQQNSAHHNNYHEQQLGAQSRNHNEQQLGAQPGNHHEQQLGAQQENHHEQRFGAEHSNRQEQQLHVQPGNHHEQQFGAEHSNRQEQQLHVQPGSHHEQQFGAEHSNRQEQQLHVHPGSHHEQQFGAEHSNCQEQQLHVQPGNHHEHQLNAHHSNHHEQQLGAHHSSHHEQQHCVQPGNHHEQQLGTEPRNHHNQQFGAQPGNHHEHQLGAQPANHHEQQLGAQPANHHEHQLCTEPRNHHNQQFGAQLGNPHEPQLGAQPDNHHEQQLGTEPRNHHDQQFGAQPVNHHEPQLGAQPGNHHEQQLGTEPRNHHDQRFGAQPGNPHDQQLGAQSGNHHQHQLGAHHRNHHDQQLGVQPINHHEHQLGAPPTNYHGQHHHGPAANHHDQQFGVQPRIHHEQHHAAPAKMHHEQPFGEQPRNHHEQQYLAPAMNHHERQFGEQLNHRNHPQQQYGGPAMNHHHAHQFGENPRNHHGHQYGGQTNNYQQMKHPPHRDSPYPPNYHPYGNQFLNYRQKPQTLTGCSTPNTWTDENFMKTFEDFEIDNRLPQMSTPDDPVIHSPPSIGATAGMNGYHAAGIKVEEPTGGCASPDDSNLDSSDESRRRQKTCRVCGDHATGYNFNVITCESCKAFFRRNALRPKDFKCPYSEDCEINSVSRRFCQKCRLRKCFTVGMKKEWILNEEQLRRRKNSRLNNTTSGGKRSQHHQQHQHPAQMSHSAVAAFQQHQQQQQQQRPLSINSLESQMMHHMQPNRPGVMPPLISPPGAQTFPLASPVGSSSSDSPPSRNLTMMHNGDKSPDAYDPNILSHRMPPSAVTTPRPEVDAQGKVVLSAEEYKQLLARIPGAQVHQPVPTEDEPTTKRQAYNVSGYPIMSNNNTPPYSQSISEMTLSRNNSTSSGGSAGTRSGHFDIASFHMGMATATGGGEGLEDMYNKMHTFCDTIIVSALDSPEGAATQPAVDPTIKNEPHPFQFEVQQFSPSDNRVDYQLNAAELKALDTVKEAFTGMDDMLEQGRQLQSFMKPNKTPADIMNIMDVTMRRFVKVAKSVPAFREVSQEGKFSLLKGGMIEMLAIRGVTRYDPATNSFKTPTVKGNVSVNVDDMFAKLNSNAQAQKEKCLEFFRFFDDEIKRNERAVHLVVLAVLFSVRYEPPMCENDVKIVTGQREFFLRLLTRYLESLYGEGARRVITRLPKALSMLNDIARNAGMLFMGTVRHGESEELPKEFFKIE